MGVKEEWLENFNNESTIKNYEIAIRHFEESIDDNLDDYLQKLRKDEVNGRKRFWKDLKNYWKSLSDLAPKTQNNKVNAVKLFFEEHSIKIPESEWSKFRRRKMRPSVPVTDDKAGSKEEWRKIINNTVNPAGKALFLVLLSTGARIGEMLQVKKDDLDLDSEPARIHLRAGYTKEGISDRYVFLTDEAKEQLLNYLEWRKGRKKRNGEPYDTERIFPFTRPNATQILKKAQVRAGIVEIDDKTGRRRIHIHSTRKFFRSNCGLGDALTHSIMGHREYLDRSYLRVDPDKAGEKFAKNMDNLQVLEVGKTSERRLRETEVRGLKLSLRAAGVPEDKIEKAFNNWATTKEVLGQARTEQKVRAILRGEEYEEIDLGLVSEEAFEDLKERLLSLATRTKQKLIHGEELEKHLADGWRYVDQNNNGKVIVEK